MIRGATVLMRDGTIAAVGAHVTIPDAAHVIDVSGAFVYPGLVDALTEQANAAPTPAAGEKPADAQPQDQAGPEGGGFFADLRAADRLAADSASLSGWRDAGVLSLHAALNRGIFTGQTAVVTIGADGSPLTVVRTPVAQRAALRTLSAPRRLGSPVPGGLFPGALLSVWAHMRQTVLDARHYGQASSLDAAQGAGVTWPESAHTLEALQLVARGAMPLIIPAQTEREVQRVIDFAEEMGVKCVVAGGNEAAAAADGLKKNGVPVLVSLNYPRRKSIALGQVREFVESASPPAPDESLREIEFRRHAPRSAGELAAAGVPFAFYSDGLKSGREYLTALRETVRHGLMKEAAIRASTLSAAEILGVGQELGSIESGKIANLIVTDRDLFDDRGRITLVVVGGHELKPPEAVRNDVLPSPQPETSAARLEPRAARIDPPPTAEKEVLITHATVMTVTNGTLKDSSILIRDGKISAVGQRLTAGPRAMTIDASGKWVTPGFVDPHEHVATDAHNDATIAVTSMSRIKDVINPTDIEIYRELGGGVTTANLLHGSVNPIGGQSAVIKLRWGRPARELLFEGAMPSIKFALGTNPKSRGTSPAPGVTRRYPASRMGVENVIRTALMDARRYQQQWAAYEQAKIAGHPPPLPPRRDLRLEPLVEVLNGRRVVHVHAYRADEMLMLMRLADEFGFRIGTFHHALEAYKVAQEIARHGAGVAGFDLLGTKVESWDGIPYNATILTHHGVNVSIGSDDFGSNHLNTEAAKTLDYGLTEDEALALITINPARQLGIEKRVGSIEVGKDADLIVFPKPPLSVYSRPETVLIDGQIYFSRDRDRQRQRALEAEKRRLTDLEETPPATTQHASSAPSRTTVNGEAPVLTPRELMASGGRAIAIRDVRIVTVSGPTIDRGTIVIRDGSIAEVGGLVVVPEDSAVVDGRGLTVYPGIFDADTALGLTEVPGVVDSDDFSEIGEFVPQLLAFNAFNLDSVMMPIDRMAGVTHAVSSPSGGMLPGQAAIMNLGGRTLEEMEIARHGALILDLPALQSYEAPAFQRRRRPYLDSRPAQTRLKELKEFFAAARAYAEKRTEWDARYEALLPAFEGTRTVLIMADSEIDIRSAVQFAEEQHLPRYAILGAADAWRVADLLKEHQVPVILGAVGGTPVREDDPIDMPCGVPSILREKGVAFALATRSPGTDARGLRHDAGLAVACGLPYETALRSITLTPAEIFGVADKLGSVEPGKIANLVVYDGDMLEYGTHLVHLFINGRSIPLASRHTELYEKYRDRR